MNKVLVAIFLTFTMSGCFLLRPPPDLAAVEQQIAELREYREAAIKAGLSGELVAQIDGVLGESQEHLRLIREAQPNHWLDLILLGAGALTGAGVFGAKAVAAAKWIHMGRGVVKGIDNFKKVVSPEVIEKLEDSLRGVMLQKDKDLVKEARK